MQNPPALTNGTTSDQRVTYEPSFTADTPSEPFEMVLVDQYGVAALFNRSHEIRLSVFCTWPTEHVFDSLAQAKASIADNADALLPDDPESDVSDD